MSEMSEKKMSENISDFQNTQPHILTLYSMLDFTYALPDMVWDITIQIPYLDTVSLYLTAWMLAR